MVEEKVEIMEPIFLEEEEIAVLAEMEEESNRKSVIAAEKSRLETSRRENILKARQVLYNSVSPINTKLLCEPVEQLMSLEETQLSSVEKGAITTSISESQKDSFLISVVVNDLVHSLADAVSTNESRDCVLRKVDDCAGSSLEKKTMDTFDSEEGLKKDEGPADPLSTAPIKIPQYIINSNLALVDATGMSIIPQEATVVKKGEEKGLNIATPISDLDSFYLDSIVQSAAAGDALANHLLDEFKNKGYAPESDQRTKEAGFNLTEQFPGISSFDKCSHEILVRVWNRDTGNPNKTGKGDFLGFIVLNSADLKDPPKGIRALSLMPDETLSTPKGVDDEILPVKGSLSVKLQATKWMVGSTTNTNKEGFPCEWRLQVAKASKIALVDRNAKTSAFCELFWRGRAVRGSSIEHYSDWLGNKTCVF